jgi:hypothetical protein
MSMFCDTCMYAQFVFVDHTSLAVQLQLMHMLDPEIHIEISLNVQTGNNLPHHSNSKSQLHTQCFNFIQPSPDV